MTRHMDWICSSASGRDLLTSIELIDANDADGIAVAHADGSGPQSRLVSIPTSVVRAQSRALNYIPSCAAAHSNAMLGTDQQRSLRHPS